MVRRDGHRVSLWQMSAVEYVPMLHRDNEKEIYDVAIVGGGITGLSLALRLQEEGLNCLLLEAWNLGFGTTGGTTAHLNTLMDTPYDKIISNFGLDNARLVAQAAKMGTGLIRDNVARYGIDCDLKETAALLFAQDATQTKALMEIYHASKRVGLDVGFSDRLPVPLDSTEILRVNGQGQFHPLRYIHALARAYEQAGGVIKLNSMVRLAEESEVITVYTDQRRFQAKNLVYATHTPPGINALHLECIPYRTYSVAVKISAPYPEELIYDMQDPYHYIRTQAIDGDQYLIVGGEDHKTAHEPNTERCLRDIESYTVRHFDVTDVVSRWSSQYYEPIDGLPYIGHYPGHGANVFVATGFGGNGMTYSQVAAIMLTDLIQKRETPFEKVFSPNRIKPIAGFKNFIGHNTDVIRQFIGKWFESEKLDEVAGLARGDGKVVRLEGETIALSKDDHGALHAISPVCTHMKCSVAWNGAEQSWECPCHGARFDNEGRVLNGPARLDLERIELRSLGADKAPRVTIASEEARK